MWIWRATVEWYWQGKIEELGEKPVPVSLCPPQSPHALTRARIPTSAVRGRWLTTWAMARPYRQCYVTLCSHHHTQSVRMLGWLSRYAYCSPSKTASGFEVASFDFSPHIFLPMRITRADFLNVRSGDYLDAIARSDTNLLLLRPSSSAVDGRLLSATSLVSATGAWMQPLPAVTVRGIWDNSKDFPWPIL
jgi:hypothetical protein